MRIFCSLATLLIFGLMACSAPSASATPMETAPAPSGDVFPTASLTPAPTATPRPQTPTAASTATSSPTLAPTETPSASQTLPPSETPKPLRGVVNVEKVSCRYGPGAMYLYLYGMLQGATQDLMGRNEAGTWILTMARGDSKSCWVKADLLTVSGDTLTLPLIPADEYRLPQSPFYPPLTGVAASRSGSVVTVSWQPLILRAGDDSLQTPYVLQLWVCRAGEPLMESLGSYETQIDVVDEGGCGAASHGRIAAAEKHGYTAFVEIPWP